jgi:ankyrin repeat protein
MGKSPLKTLDQSLYDAAAAGDEAAVAWALERGANPDAPRERDLRPLAAASGLGHAGCARLLIAGGAVLDRLDQFGRTAAMHAACFGREEVLRALARAGADLEVRSGSGSTALIVAADYGQAGCARVLVDAGADIAAVSADGATACSAAATGGHLECLKYLLEAGALAEHAETGQRRPLNEAAGCSDPSCLMLLLDRGAAVDGRDPVDALGWTAAMSAANYGKAKCLAVLLEAGADVELVDAMGRSAEDLASMQGCGECARMIRAQREKRSIGAEAMEAKASSSRIRM